MMRQKFIATSYCALGLHMALMSGVLLAEDTSTRSTDPAIFTSVTEIPLHGKVIVVSGPTVGVDNQSTIRIHFETDRMTKPRPLREGAPARPAVTIRIEAYSVRGTSRTPIAPIRPFVDNYSPPEQTTSGAGGGGGGAQGADGAEEDKGSGATDKDTTANKGTIVFRDKIFDP